MLMILLAVQDIKLVERESELCQNNSSASFWLADVINVVLVVVLRVRVLADT